ncbi:amidoligase family protein [Pontibacter silvestris]|uniref:Amidoligase family protein n=1 Tax=Pontibacter silvestris TaxID=2305183 RepID=A0ABW4X0A6_9BACT|nr:amidoligase family protein [Pontibacter silvestris]MCC9135168.1 amidoligase family protein [Pontibacter silvestris]
MQFKQLPVLCNAKGDLRKVGFELEFANVGIEESVQIVQELYGGQVQKKHRFSQKVVDTRLGDFSIEIDLKLLNEKTYKAPLDKLNINLQDIKLGESTLEFEVETALENLARTVLPYEIGTPPVACTELEQLELLRKALYEHRAEGTKAFLTNAYGTHINPELPDTDIATILNYLRAFLLLYPWLLKAGETDFARRMTSFINPYKADYTALVLNPTYKPDLDKLIEDYHLYNPDRNRPLDLYPLFAALREEKISQYTNLGKVKARTTFHYRLPNSSVADPNWSLAQEWNLWVVIEELANDPERLEQMCLEYLTLKDNTFIGFDNKWIEHTERWLS